jgi:stage III sporulation protein AC
METDMDIELILKVAGVGILVATASQILSKSGKDEHAMLLTVTGVIVVMLMLIGEMGGLIAELRGVFGI